MIWSCLTMLVCSVGLAVLHMVRRSRHVWTAAFAVALAALATLGGFSIGVFVAPLAVIALVLAALAVPRSSTIRRV